MDKRRELDLVDAVEEYEDAVHEGSSCDCSGIAIQMGDCQHIKDIRKAELKVVVMAQRAVDD